MCSTKGDITASHSSMCIMQGQGLGPPDCPRGASCNAAYPASKAQPPFSMPGPAVGYVALWVKLSTPSGIILFQTGSVIA